MTLVIVLVALLPTAGGCVPSSAPMGPAAIPASSRGDVIRRALTSVVQLRSEREGGVRRAASGVVVATDAPARRAWIVTVRHFVTPSRPQQIFVEVPSRRGAVPALVMSVSADDMDLDLAIIEVDGVDVTPARLKDTASLGDEVLVVAFPWGQRFTVVRGIVSQVAPGDVDSRVTGPARLIDASVSYGSSGGGAFDARTGELIGIVETYRTAKITIPELKDRAIEVPVPGETTLVPAAVIHRFLEDFGLGRRLPK